MNWASILLLLVVWPFHHKKPAVECNEWCAFENAVRNWHPKVIPDYSCLGIGDGEACGWHGPTADCKPAADEGCVEIYKGGDICELQDDLYFYVAEDGTISFSHAGCEAAKTNVEAARTFNQFGSRKI